MAGPPVGFESALLNRPPVPGLGPVRRWGWWIIWRWIVKRDHSCSAAQCSRNRKRTERKQRARTTGSGKKKGNPARQWRRDRRRSSGARDLADGGYGIGRDVLEDAHEIRAKLAATCRVKFIHLGHLTSAPRTLTSPHSEGGYPCMSELPARRAGSSTAPSRSLRLRSE